MFKKIDTPEHLNRLVYYIFKMEQTKELGESQYLLPSTTQILGFIFEGGWRIEIQPKANILEKVLPRFYTAGQVTCGYNITITTNKSKIIGVALRPDALWQILKKDISYLTNNAEKSEIIFAKFEFEKYKNQFLGTKSESEKLKIIIDFLTHVSENINYEYNPATEAVKLIVDKKGVLKVSEICAEMKLQERYLQRNFKKVIGTSIKDFIRCVRFNHLFTELFLKTANQDVETLIYLYNYYDLSHYHKDYKYFFKTTPSQEHKERFCLFEELITNGKYLLLE